MRPQMVETTLVMLYCSGKSLDHIICSCFHFCFRHLLILLNSCMCLIFQCLLYTGLFRGHFAFLNAVIVIVVYFKKIEATKPTAQGVIWLIFCVLLFVGWLIHYYRERNLVSNVFYAFKWKSRLVGPSQKVNFSSRSTWPKLKSRNWLFFRTLGSTSCSLTKWVPSRFHYIDIIFCTVKTKHGLKMEFRSKWFRRSFICFFFLI